MRLPTCLMGQPGSADPGTGKDREVGTSLLEPPDALVGTGGAVVKVDS
jgi:hypothetical protein